MDANNAYEWLQLPDSPKTVPYTQENVERYYPTNLYSRDQVWGSSFSLYTHPGFYTHAQVIKNQEDRARRQAEQEAQLAWERSWQGQLCNAVNRWRAGVRVGYKIIRGRATINQYGEYEEC